MHDSASEPPPGGLPAWQSEAKYRTLFDSIDEGFCVTQVLFDEAGHAVDDVFLEANPSFERQTGLVGAVGRTMRSLAPAHEEHWFSTYGDVARSGRPVRFEAPAEALQRWFDVYAFRVGDPGQHLVAILFNDVSRRKELERSVSAQNEALREADVRMDRFLAMLSHELRNPLAPLKVAADLLARADLSAQELARTGDIVRRQVGHMARLLDDLLDVARITQGKLVLQPQRVRPAEVIDTALEAVRPLLERKHHSLDVALEDGAPLLRVDPVRLAQIVANLLTNAAKYTDPGGRIGIATRIDGDDWVLRVQDSGIGIAPEAVGRLFEMFSQVHEDIDRSEGGLGIGLLLVNGLVALHGGTVRAESDGPGSGSVFTVRLPRARERGDAGVAAPANELPLRGRKVLLADDNADITEALAMLLVDSAELQRLIVRGAGA